MATLPLTDEEVETRIRNQMKVGTVRHVKGLALVAGVSQKRVRQVAQDSEKLELIVADGIGGWVSPRAQKDYEVERIE